MERAHIIGNRIGSRDSGTGKSNRGNREAGTSSLFLILAFITYVSKVQIGNREPVPHSF